MSIVSFLRPALDDSAPANVFPYAKPAPCLTRRRYRLPDMVRLLALDDLSPRAQIDRLRMLARVDGLPPPLNARVWGGKVLHGADAIHAKSQWDAASVDAWVHQPGPGEQAVPEQPVALSIRDEMRARAAKGARA